MHVWRGGEQGQSKRCMKWKRKELESKLGRWSGGVELSGVEEGRGGEQGRKVF